MPDGRTSGKEESPITNNRGSPCDNKPCRMRETNKFIDIKRNIAWKLCTELLSSPVPIRPAAPELSSNASGNRGA